MTDTDLLRRAATKARETATVASKPPWHLEEGRQSIYAEDGTYITSPWGDDTPDLDMDHIALWHPGVALAVAEWLDQHAEEHSIYECRWEEWACAALATARALLGEGE